MTHDQTHYVGDTCPGGHTDPADTHYWPVTTMNDQCLCTHRMGDHAKTVPDKPMRCAHQACGCTTYRQGTPMTMTGADHLVAQGLADETRHVFIAAHNHRQATRAAKIHNIPPNRWTYLSHPEKLRGSYRPIVLFTTFADMTPAAAYQREFELTKATVLPMEY